MAESRRALFLCRHCQALVYVERRGARGVQPCPRCRAGDLESVTVPHATYATQALGHLLGVDLSR
ncbi:MULTISPECIES: hypothetical protein [Modicisalibacter]|uniref:Uncharacterized protein n=1 Tax=Modicisalibacter tunisiensis TaxID=390637 RepID=A0ABS7WX02_9GAMM|nr:MULTISPECIES: hypothetical protein [Modicisalibacter]MBZ9539918.1 hypothetical protein [Modicisalibacter tunisiensis]MBZ9566684.1 hypothetical protein [Modicisalibacter tunisiensis]